MITALDRPRGCRAGSRPTQDLRDWRRDHPEDLARYRDAKLPAADAANAANAAGEHLTKYNARKQQKVVDETGLIAAARLLRHYHQVVAGWRTEESLVWADGTTGTGTAGDGLVDAVIAAHRTDLELVERLAAAGHARQLQMIADGDLANTRRWLRWCEHNRSLFG